MWLSQEDNNLICNVYNVALLQGLLKLFIYIADREENVIKNLALVFVNLLTIKTVLCHL